MFDTKSIVCSVFYAKKYNKAMYQIKNLTSTFSLDGFTDDKSLFVKNFNITIYITLVLRHNTYVTLLVVLCVQHISTRHVRY